MSLVEALALRVNRAVASFDGPAVRPPGGGLAARFVEPGFEMTVVHRGDAVDVYYGARSITAFSMSPGTALRLAWFIVWRWWALATWCGLKSSLWRWSIEVVARAARRPKERKNAEQQATPAGLGPPRQAVR
jgi:hypothetical protein